MAHKLPALTDTHCHLDFKAFDEDREAMIGRAIDAGVQRMLVPALDQASCQAAIRLAERFEQVFAAIGVHPNSANAWEDGTLTALQGMAQHSRVVAIGEIGLDFYWDKATPEQQQTILREQLELAAACGLPVVIHNREASETVLAFLIEWQMKLAADHNDLQHRPGVLHSYSGNLEQARRALDHGFYLGFTGPVTFKKSDALRELIAELPLERILIETDAPFLAPEPFRGKRNEPAYVSYIARQISELHHITESELAEITFENAARLFEWN
jgi:TatD DNase family protein